MIIGHLNTLFSINRLISVVILTILCPAKGKIVDRSQMCKEGRHLDVRLTNSMGLSDSYILLIANTRKLNCSFSFSVDKDLHIILVVQLPDWRPGWKMCGNDANEILVMVRDSETVNVCKYLKEKLDDIYYVLVRRKVGVKVLSQGGMDSIKITATSARDSGIAPCNTHNEIECKKNNHTYCLVNVFECDGDFNCGVKDQFDEDKLSCYGYEKLSWTNVIMIMITTLITVLLMLAIIKNLLPKKKEILIYHGRHMFTEGLEQPEKPFLVEVETRYLDHGLIQRRIFPLKNIEVSKEEILNGPGLLTKRSSRSIVVRSLE